MTHVSPLHSALALSVVCGTVVFGQQSSPAKPAAPVAKAAAPLIDANRPIMQVEEVSFTGPTAIFGDRAKIGPYILRQKLNGKQAARPHFDDQDQFITVMKGTLWIGKGDVFTPAKLLPVREGGVIYLPANTHFFQVAGEGDVVVQISGNGPVKSTHTEVDAKGQPVAENGPYPSLTPPPRRRNVDPDLLTPDEIEQMERAAAAAKAAAAKKAAAEEKK